MSATLPEVYLARHGETARTISRWNDDCHAMTAGERHSGAAVAVIRDRRTSVLRKDGIA